MKLFWGLIVLIFGGVLLGINQGWIDSSIWWGILALWPIILIILGLKLLIKNEKVLSLITFMVVLLAAFFVFFTYRSNLNDFPDSWNLMGTRVNRQSYSESLTDTYDPTVVKGVDIDVSTGAITLNIKELSDDVDPSTLYRINTTDMGKIQVSKTVNNDELKLEINESQMGMHFATTAINRKLDLYLPKSVLLKLDIDSGASKVTLDYSGLNVATSDINIGASSGDIYFNEKVLRQALNVNAGASNLVFHIPRKFGVDVTFDGGLNTINSDPELDILKNGDSYVSRNLEDKAGRITITGNTGVSNIKFLAE